MKKKLIIVLVILLAIFGLVYLGANLYMDSLLNKTQEEAEPVKDEDVENTIVEDTTEKAHEVFNIVIIGADNSASDRTNSFEEERSDVFKIASLDYTDKTIKLTSLDRDVVVFIPDRDAYGHFNWAYSYGGAKYALNTINYNLDLDTSKYVSFSFGGFVEVIDIIGGIDVNLSAAEANAFNGYGSTNATMRINAKEGINHLDGHDALAYARQRYVDNDFVRMDRQNIVIKAVINKVKSLSATEILDVINACLPYITTNLTNKEIKSLLTDVIGFDLSNIKTHTYPTNEYDDICRASGIGGYLLRSYSNQVIELHKFIYGTDTYIPTSNIYENEDRTYKTYGEFYENSSLLP